MRGLINHQLLALLACPGLTQVHGVRNIDNFVGRRGEPQMKRHAFARPRGELLPHKPTNGLLVVLADRSAIAHHPPDRQLKRDIRFAHQERH